MAACIQVFQGSLIAINQNQFLSVYPQESNNLSAFKKTMHLTAFHLQLHRYATGRMPQHSSIVEPCGLSLSGSETFEANAVLLVA